MARKECRLCSSGDAGFWGARGKGRLANGAGFWAGFALPPPEMAGGRLLLRIGGLKGLGVERALERMERSIDRCVGIISDLLDFARVKDLARETTAIDTWLSEFLAEQELPAGVTLQAQLGCGARLSFDRERLERAVANLLANAVQAMTDPQWIRPDGRPSEITVSTRINGPFVEVAVADSGPGIAAEVLPKIFDPLFTTRNFGVGLGLPLVRQIMQQHRGSVAVEKTAGGGGATFILRLPLEFIEDLPQEKAA